MALNTVKIFADLTNAQLVASSRGSATKPIVNPFHQDKLYFSVQPLISNPDGIQGSNPYSTPDASGYVITALIIDSTGTTLSGPTVLSAVDGTAKAGSIDLNTAAMTTAFTLAATASIPAVLYLQIDDSANQKVTIKSAFTINRTYITGSTPSALPLTSYLTRDECLALFVKWSGNQPGAAITLTDSTNTYQTVLQCNTDGSNASDAIR